MDAITIQVLRNKIASLVEEMHYHFYRSGYSTIIRESRDFSCVILDRDRAPDRRAADVLSRAGLSPPGDAHPRALRRLRRGGHPRGRRVRLQPPVRGRAAARVRHGVRRAGVRRWRDRRLLRLDRPQGGRRRHRAGLDLGQRHRALPRGPADPADQDPRAGPRAPRRRAADPRQQSPAGPRARRRAGADRGDRDGGRARPGAWRRVSARPRSPAHSRRS